MSLIDDFCGCSTGTGTGGSGTLSCSAVNACVNKQLVRVEAGLSSSLLNFCGATSKCINTELGLIAIGGVNNLSNFDNALFYILRNLPGFSSTGDIVLSLHNNIFEWQTVAGVGTPYTDEQAQDAIGTILGPEFTYNDATPSISLDVANGISKGAYVQLGQPISTVGNPAALLANTELPLGDFYLTLNNKTGVGTDQSSIKFVTSNVGGVNVASVDFAARNTISIDMVLSNTAGIMQTSYANGGGDLGASGYFVSGVGGHFYLANMRGSTTHSSVEVGGSATQTWTTSGDTLLGLFGTKNTGFGGITAPAAFVDIQPSTTTTIPLKIAAGVDPTANYQNGAIWQGNDLHFYGRLGGVNKQLDNDYNFTPNSFIQNQITIPQFIANYWIDGNGRIDGYLQFGAASKIATADYGSGLELIVQSLDSPIPYPIGDSLRMTELHFFTTSVGAPFVTPNSYPSSSYINSPSAGSIQINTPYAVNALHGGFVGGFDGVSFNTSAISISNGATEPVLHVGGGMPLHITGADSGVGIFDILDLFNFNFATHDSPAKSFLTFSKFINDGLENFPLGRRGTKKILSRIGAVTVDNDLATFKSDFIVQTADATINTGLPTEYLRVKYDGRLIATGYSTLLTAPITTGVKHMLTVDATGLFSHEAIPSGGGGGGGSVSSVNLSMPSAFTVTGNPITSSGTLNVTGAGTSDQVIKGDGSLGGVSLSSILAATAVNTINNRNWKQTWSWDTHAVGNALTLSSVTPNAATGSALLAVICLGSVAPIATTGTYAATIKNQRIGIASNVGLMLHATGSSSQNVALSVTANGGTIEEYAISAEGGDIKMWTGNLVIDTGYIVLTSLANGSSQNRIVGQNSADSKLGYISVGSGLALTGGVLSATGGGGSDTNFAISNLTASGDRTHDWANNDLTFINIDNLAFTVATATTLTCANVSLPSITNLATQNRILGQFGTGGRVGYITVGSGLDLTAGVLSSTAGGGSVTTIAVAGLSPLFTTGVTNPTTTPSVSFTLSNAGANTYFGNSTVGSTAPAFTAAGAFTVVNDTNITATLGANAPTSLLRNVALTFAWAGTLAVDKGGSNIASYTIGDQTYASGATTLTKIGIGTAGQLWRVNAGATAPEWFTPTYLSAAITTLNTLTAATQTFAVGTSGTDFNINSSVSTHTFNIPTAGIATRGLVGLTAQTLGDGIKTFNVGVVINASGTNTAGGGDFRVASDNFSNAIFVSSTLDRIGINTSVPSYTFDVIGTTRISGSVGISAAPSGSAALNIGTPSPCQYTIETGSSALTPNINSDAAFLHATGSITESTSGTHNIFASILATGPTITGGLAAVTNAATVYITNAPNAVGATNSALLVNSGTSRFFGDIVLGSGVSYVTGGYDIMVRNQTSGRFEIIEPDIVGFNSQSGTAYTLVLADKGQMIRTTNVSANTVTVPPNSSVAFSIGTQILIYREGAGLTSVVAGIGVTINSSDSALKLRVQNSVATLIKIATNTWVLSGDITV